MIQQPERAVWVYLKTILGSRGWGRKMDLGHAGHSELGYWGARDGPSCPHGQWGDAKSLWGACPKSGSSPSPLIPTLKSSSVDPSDEDGMMQRTWSPPCRASLFQVSKDLVARFTSWAGGRGAQRVHFCPHQAPDSVLLTSSPARVPSDRKPRSSQRPSVPAGGQGS